MTITMQEWHALSHIALHLAGENAKVLWYDTDERRLYVKPGFSQHIHFMEIHTPENGFDIHTAVLFMCLPPMHEVPICDCLVTREMEVIIS